MSLKVFHIFFISVAALFSCALGVWLFMADAAREFAYSSFIVSACMLCYGISFVRKTKRIAI